MQKIELKQVVRDCPHNTKILRDGTPKRELIRDFEVIIDGEHRATLSRNYTGKGYRIGDADGRTIKDPQDGEGWRHTAEVSSQAHFTSFIARLLVAGAIPTLDDIKMDRIRDAAWSDNKRFNTHLSNVDAAKKHHVDRLYEIVRQVAHADGPVLEAKLVRLATKTLDMIEAQVATWNKTEERD